MEVDTVQELLRYNADHRGQVTNMLRVLGARPEETDFLVFWDEGGGTPPE
jgi:uncharacterized damage-inducible protein DinB